MVEIHNGSNEEKLFFWEAVGWRFNLDVYAWRGVLLPGNVRLHGWKWVQDRQITHEVTKSVLKQH